MSKPSLFELPAPARQRLEAEAILWLATRRPDGRPHLVPLWFALVERSVYVCVQARSVKVRNILVEPRVALALESGSQPLVCEGRATLLAQPWPETVREAFLQKYAWDIGTDGEYDALVEVALTRLVMG